MRSIPANEQSISAIGIKALSTAFKPSDRIKETPNRPTQRPNRDFRATARTSGTDTEEGTKMKKLGFATIIASGLTAVAIGFAGGAQADVVHHDWVHDIQPQVTVPQIDTTVQLCR